MIELTDLVVVLVEGNVESAQVGVQAGILDRSEVGAFARLITMLVPVARRRDKGSSGFPIHPRGIFDVAIGV